MTTKKHKRTIDDHDKLLRKNPRKVRLYFDENDEAVDEATALSDPDNFYHKYHIVEIDLDPESMGDRITKDTFKGSHKGTDNALIFLENLEKSK